MAHSVWYGDGTSAFWAMAAIALAAGRRFTPGPARTWAVITVMRVDSSHRWSSAMDTYFIVLRLVHIVAGTFWVGGALLNVAFLEPTVRASGAEGGRFMARLAGDAHYGPALSIASLFTIVSGFLLYRRISGGLHWAWVTTNTGMAFTIGALAGSTAFALGLGVIARTAGQLSALNAQVQTTGGSPLPEQVRQLDRLQARLHQAALIEAPLIIVAVSTMAIARYL
jgi:hypothetical protein